MKYNEIVKKANTIKNGVETEYKLKASTPAYYIAKTILNQSKTDVENIKIAMASNSNGDYISNQAYKTTYLDMAKRLTKYVEANGQLPNNIKAKLDNKTYYVKVGDYVYMFSRILVYFDEKGELPKYANINSKAFIKPTETGNVVYDYWVKKFGFKPTSLDEILEYVAKHFNYEYYYDDIKSNAQVIQTKAGNCTDLLQMLYNLAKKLGYTIEVLHVHCSGGDGHVRARFKHPKHTNGEWIYRDIACVASTGNIYCNWCTSGYTLLAVNPSWFMQNVNR